MLGLTDAERLLYGYSGDRKNVTMREHIGDNGDGAVFVAKLIIGVMVVSPVFLWLYVWGWFAWLALTGGQLFGGF